MTEIQPIKTPTESLASVDAIQNRSEDRQEQENSTIQGADVTSSLAKDVVSLGSASSPSSAPSYGGAAAQASLNSSLDSAAQNTTSNAANLAGTLAVSSPIEAGSTTAADATRAQAQQNTTVQSSAPDTAPSGNDKITKRPTPTYVIPNSDPAATSTAHASNLKVGDASVSSSGASITIGEAGIPTTVNGLGTALIDDIASQKQKLAQDPDSPLLSTSTGKQFTTEALPPARTGGDTVSNEGNSITISNNGTTSTVSGIGAGLFEEIAKSGSFEPPVKSTKAAEITAGFKEPTAPALELGQNASAAAEFAARVQEATGVDGTTIEKMSDKK